MMDIKKQLNQSGLQPSKKSGQCFLLDQAVLEKIAMAGGLKKNDTVLEIGAGLGNLTVLLARSAGRVIAVENDRQLIPLLRKNIGSSDNVQIIEDDILNWRRTQPAALSQRGYAVVANIPYYLTSAVLREFLSRKPQPNRIILLVQAEVADRIVARPGGQSLLSVSVQYYGQPEKLLVVPRTCFWPVPEVDSAVIGIEVRREPQPADREFFRLVRSGFSARRKQLQNNLSAVFHLTRPEVLSLFDKCNIAKNARAQELSMAQWRALFNQEKTSFMANVGKGHKVDTQGLL